MRPERFNGTRAEIPLPCCFSRCLDFDGNTQNDGTYSYTWDAFCASRMVLRDGDGRRVYKSSGKLYWFTLSAGEGYGPEASGGDEILAETDGSGNTTAEYIFFGGKRVAMLPAGSNPLYYVSDFLGTSRIVAQNNGAVCAVYPERMRRDGDFTPFGGELPWTNTCPAQNNYKFEGKERDTETSNDDFGARSYSWRFGRWLSADWSAVPVPVPYANLTNPQTLNLYAMVADDPESFADLDGHMVPLAADDRSCSLAAPMCMQLPDPPNTKANETAYEIKAPLAAHWDPPDEHGIRHWVGDYDGEKDCRTGRCLYWNKGTQTWEEHPPQKAQDSSASVVVLALPRLIARPIAGAAAGFVAVFLGTVAVIDTFKYFAKGGKQNIKPTWAEGERPLPGETARDFAKRLCDKRYGPGNYNTGPREEYNKIIKWAQEKFGI